MRLEHGTAAAADPVVVRLLFGPSLNAAHTAP
jgi:hypothetical protein